MKKLYRCRWDKKVAGVCGGLGQYFRCDPTVIRLSILTLFFITGIIPVAIVYAIMWLTVPLGPSVYVVIPGKKLYRSTTDRKISGVCGGLGEYFNISTLVIRIIFVIACIFTAFFPILLSYIIGMTMIPENPD
jgi:phage shock protein C